MPIATALPRATDQTATSSGDEAILHAVSRCTTRPHAEAPGDLDAVSEEDLAATFGPQWAVVTALIHGASTLSDEHAAELAEVAREPARIEALAAVLVAAQARGRADAVVATRDAVLAAVFGTGLAAAWAATCAALSVCVADLVGRDGLTEEHLSVLEQPWVRVLGDVEH